MKKISIASMLVAVAMLPTMTFAYSDTSGHWSEKYIDTLSKDNIVNGYSDGSFKPDSYITRAELVTIVNRMLKNTAQSYKYIPDINSTDWYAGEIRKAVYSELMYGDNDGYVRPNDYVTREEAIVILQRAFVSNKNVHEVMSYKDLDKISAWSKDAFYTFIELGYINGYEDNTLRPNGNITRGEVSKILNYIFNVKMPLKEDLDVVHGNLLINEKKVNLKNIVIDDDLVISEGTNGETKLENIVINGSLILRSPLASDSKNIKVKNEIVKLYENFGTQTGNEYINNEYGISFSIPANGKVIEIVSEKQQLNFDTKNLVTLRIEQSEDLLFTSFESTLKKERKRFASIYKEIIRGRIGLSDYVVCGDNDGSYFLLIKRDDVVYTLYFYNISDYNVVDNLVNSIKLTEAERITPHVNLIYKKPALYLKFSYKDYVGVDDSYNTGEVYKGDAPFKLFIQVNDVTDMSEYSLSEIRSILQMLELQAYKKIESTENKKVYQYDAVQFDIFDETEEKLYKSLYVIIETKLYHFIFTGDTDKMISIGDETFNNIVSSIEF